MRKGKVKLNDTTYVMDVNYVDYVNYVNYVDGLFYSKRFYL